MPQNNGFTEVPFNNDTMLAGDDYVTGSETVATGNVLPKGQIVGRVTASGEIVALNTAATDGSQTPYAILAEAVDATAGALIAPVYLSGEFKESALTPAVTTAIKDALRALNIYTKASV